MVLRLLGWWLGGSKLIGVEVGILFEVAMTHQNLQRMRTSRNVTTINAGSMADIAFLLLLFFLVSTTISQEKGLLPDAIHPTQRVRVKVR